MTGGELFWWLVSAAVAVAGWLGLIPWWAALLLVFLCIPLWTH